MSSRYLTAVLDKGDKWPFLTTEFDQEPTLRIEEQAALSKPKAPRNDKHPEYLQHTDQELQRLVLPIEAALTYLNEAQDKWYPIRAILLAEMYRRGTTFWTWNPEEWSQTIGTCKATFCIRHQLKQNYLRPVVLACAYLLGSFTNFHRIGSFDRLGFTANMFGQDAVQKAIGPVAVELKKMGLGPTLINYQMPQVVVTALLVNRSPKLEDLSLTVLEQLRSQTLPPTLRRVCVPVSRALVNLGVITHPLIYARMGPKPQVGIADTVPVEWLAWCQRWHATSTLAQSTRNNKLNLLLKIGRWLAAKHPDITSPAQWTRELAAECIAVVDSMQAGQWIHPHTTHLPAEILGKPFRPNSKSAQLAAIRTFFIDCQDWQWLAVRFDPRRCLAVPGSIQALRGPNPQIVADDIWAKLLSAGLTLTASDLPACTYRHDSGLKPKSAWYPLEMVRALVMIWLFAGLRSDEIYRLRVGCSRWQTNHPDDLQNQSHQGICLLDVPVNKTSIAFVKPVDRLVGEAIEAWEKIRPPGARQLDRKTSELVHFLFVYRGKRIGIQYLNQSIIPMLCRKAGVPEADARGRITSHRARSTIATQLYNAREPMSLFELQEWMGHRSPSSTQHYAKITPTKLAQAYTDAGYFGRNIRMIEVLIDQEVIQNGAAAQGEPYMYYDMGHGYCTYNFFDQCAHRMACAKCSFYRPKASTQGQLLEGKTHLQRMLQAIPLLEDERAAVEDGLEAMDKLLQRLANEPTPSK